MSLHNFNYRIKYKFPADYGYNDKFVSVNVFRLLYYYKYKKRFCTVTIMMEMKENCLMKISKLTYTTNEILFIIKKL